MKFKELCTSINMEIDILRMQSTLSSSLASSKESLTIDEYTGQFQELYNLHAPDESPTHDLACYIKGLRPDVWEKLKVCQTVQEAYKKAIRVEHMLRWSHMRQFTSQNEKSQQKITHIVETHFAKRDNPKLVNHRLLTTNRKEEDEWRHNATFQTRVRCEGKLTNRAIDHGNAINFVA